MPNGKNKGNSFERWVCTTLSKWWSKGLLNSELTDVFWRTHNSGGRATSRNKTGRRTKGQYGDVCATDPLGQPLIDLLTIELKTGYSGHSFADIIDKPAKAKQQLYEGWFIKAYRDSVASGSRGWLLIAKRNRRVPIVFLPDVVGEMLIGDCSGLVNIPTTWGIVICMTLEEFLSLVSPKLIVNLLS